MIDLKQYGYTEIEPPPDGLIPGRVTELQRERYTVITERGETAAVLKGAFCHEAEAREDFPCVGDFVLLQYNDSGVSGIAKLSPRRSKFSRADFSGHAAGYAKTIVEQVVAANFDYVFILSSLNWDFNVNRIMRYLTQTWQSGGQPVVILTKADLAGDFSEELADVLQAAPGVPSSPLPRAVEAIRALQNAAGRAANAQVHAVYAHTGFGLNALDEYLQPGKTVVFLGMSGVGKSSLVNALMERDVMAVKEIREDDSRGRHMTTHRQLFMLPSGAMVIDTPGMRELGLFGADKGISAGFSDVEDLFAQCRFNDCRHKTEPGCAVLAALTDGSLPRERWERYLAQKRENKFVDDKAGYLTDKKTRHKDIAKWSKQMKKNGGFKK